MSRSAIPRRIKADPESTGAPRGFPVGAKVLMDGRYLAIVKAYFPQGSSSYMWPHYKVDFVGGDLNVVVPIYRVGTSTKPATTSELEHE